MKLSAFKSFTSFYRKKSGIAGVGSKRFSASNLCLAVLLVSISAQSQGSVVMDTQAFHITAADGVKSIAQLIQEQNTGTPVPNSVASSYFIVVDAENDALEFTQIGDQPAGFKFVILPGNHIQFANPESSAPAPVALQNWRVRTQGTCNVLMISKFW